MVGFRDVARQEGSREGKSKRGVTREGTDGDLLANVLLEILT